VGAPGPANLLHWMVLHSPLTVTARSEHSFDPFPDNGRVVPWGTGCSIVYDYVDLCVRNDTDLTFQLRARVGERHLRGELRADATPPHTYSVHARDGEFVRLGDTYLRRNELGGGSSTAAPATPCGRSAFGAMLPW